MSALSPTVYPLVVQHNALVNAQFSLSTTESRLFLAMLAGISPQDTEFVKCQVEIHEILESTSNNYAHVRKVLDDFGGCKLRIEELSSDGRRQKRTFTVIPLVEYAEYREGEGFVEARFNTRLLPYLLELRDNFTKAQLAELIKLKSPSSFRIYWLLREYASALPGLACRAQPKAEPAWETALVDVFDDHQRRCGTRRLQVELREWGHSVGRQALRTALRRHGRKALQPKAFTPRTTDSTHDKRCAPNLLLDQSKPTQANRVWVSDITYLPLANGQWVYCCAFQDVCSKQVVGWQVRADIRKP